MNSRRKAENRAHRRLVSRWTAVLAGGLLVGCAPLTEPGPPNASEQPQSPPPAAAIRVELHFGADSDLDLQVTGPDLETVYYGHPQSRAGARFRSDARCDAPVPRTETVEFPVALAGRYRVSVDHPRACESEPSFDPSIGPPFEIRVTTDTDAQRFAGHAPLGRFQPIVFEFDIECDGDGDGESGHAAGSLTERGVDTAAEGPPASGSSLRARRCRH